jgi:tryptophan synthase alpha chain
MSAPTNRLDSTFARLRGAGELGLFPYLTAGYPDRTTALTLIEAMVRGGADGLELGVPFSDPLADGITLQRASARALEAGVTVEDALELVRQLRRRHQAPALLMSYLNPLLSYGLDRLCREGQESGLDGLIVPDLPFEESDGLREACWQAGLHLISMVAPTSGPDRLSAVGRTASGFVYCVALVGTTGARGALAPELPELLARARAAIPAPLVAGFGIATPEQVVALAGQVDGVIVASALADLVERTGSAEVAGAVEAFVRELKAATKKPLPVAER